MVIKTKGQHLPCNLEIIQKIVVRKMLIQMADERRIGNELRGFSKLLLEEIGNEAWPIAQMETQLFKKEIT